MSNKGKFNRRGTPNIRYFASHVKPDHERAELMDSKIKHAVEQGIIRPSNEDKYHMERVARAGKQLCGSPHPKNQILCTEVIDDHALTHQARNPMAGYTLFQWRVEDDD